jgi:Fe-S-cluster containining protein
MNEDRSYPQGIEGSSLAERLHALEALYAEADAACATFLGQARLSFPARTHGGLPFGCPDGCGACCERFVPDILPLEADYAALWILRNRPELAEVGPRSSAPCPYYDADNAAAHCRIYGGRPLICRLFGFSAVVGKDGEASYSLCWKMPLPEGARTRSWGGRDLAETFGASPPLMARFGLKLEALSPPARHPRPLLGEAINDSIGKLRLLLSLASGDLSA